jgi:hypothetical protein
MLAAVRSAALVGIDAYDVIVEVDAAAGLPQWTIVGLAAGAVGNGREACDPGDSDHHNGSNDEGDGNRGHHGRDGGQ